MIEFDFSKKDTGALFNRLETHVDVKNPALSKSDIGKVVKERLEKANTPAFLRELRGQLSFREITEQANPIPMDTEPIIDVPDLAIFSPIRLG